MRMHPPVSAGEGRADGHEKVRKVRDPPFRGCRPVSGRVCARTLPSTAAAARNVGCAPLPGSRMRTAQEDGMRMRSTVVGKLWARILLALAAGAITGFVSLHRAQSGAVQATPPDVALAGSR